MQKKSLQFKHKCAKLYKNKKPSGGKALAGYQPAWEPLLGDDPDADGRPGADPAVYGFSGDFENGAEYGLGTGERTCSAGALPSPCFFKKER